jgi:hypothetical protein
LSSYLASTSSLLTLSYLSLVFLLSVKKVQYSLEGERNHIRREKDYLQRTYSLFGSNECFYRPGNVPPLLRNFTYLLLFLPCKKSTGSISATLSLLSFHDFCIFACVLVVLVSHNYNRYNETQCSFSGFFYLRVGDRLCPCLTLIYYFGDFLYSENGIFRGFPLCNINKS